MRFIPSLFRYLSPITLPAHHRALAICLLAVGLGACKKVADSPLALRVVSVASDSVRIDLPVQSDSVPVGKSIRITFNKIIDTASVRPGVFSLITGENLQISARLLVKDSLITLTPVDSLLVGTRYTLKIASTLRGAGGEAFAGELYSFYTFGPRTIVPPQATSQIAYFRFNGDLADYKGAYTTSYSADIAYVPDHKGYAGSALSFNGVSSLVEIAGGSGLVAGPSNTTAFWVRLDTTNTHPHYVMGLNLDQGNSFEFAPEGEWVRHLARFATGPDTAQPEELYFNGDGKTRGTGTDTASTFRQDLTLTGGPKALLGGRWVHVVHTYDAVTRLRTLYLNGAKAEQRDYNLRLPQDPARRFTGASPRPASADGTATFSDVFAFGFAKDRSATYQASDPASDITSPTSNHFKGSLDEVRFFSVPLTEPEVSALYNAER